MGVVGTRKPRWEWSRGQGRGEDFDESRGFPTQFGAAWPLAALAPAVGILGCGWALRLLSWMTPVTRLGAADGVLDAGECVGGGGASG